MVTALPCSKLGDDDGNTGLLLNELDLACIIGELEEVSIDDDDVLLPKLDPEGGFGLLVGVYLVVVDVKVDA